MSTHADRLLIIDDEPEIGAFIGDVAEDLGFDVVATNPPEEFWSSYGPFAPTVIVIDLVMPHADGVELLRALAEKSAGAQILLISGVDPGILATARRLGTDRGLRMLGALQKPMVVTDLEAMLRAGMQGHRAVTEPELREAIKAGQLVVNYQPKASLTRDGVWVIDAAEALVRWERPRHGMVMPDEFIPLAEQSDLVSKVFDFVLRQALEQAGFWRREGLSLGIAVNVA